MRSVAPTGLRCPLQPLGDPPPHGHYQGVGNCPLEAQCSFHLLSMQPWPSLVSRFLCLPWVWVMGLVTPQVVQASLPRWAPSSERSTSCPGGRPWGHVVLLRQCLSLP